MSILDEMDPEERDFFLRLLHSFAQGMDQVKLKMTEDDIVETLLSLFEKGFVTLVCDEEKQAVRLQDIMSIKGL